MTAAAHLRPGQLFRLAAHDLWHERWLALCAACVLAAMLAPLWTLWGLERGVIGTMIARMDGDPLMRKVEPTATGNNRFDSAWFERVRAWPEVEFVIPTVRSAAALVDLFAEGAAAPVTTELRETAAGDPLLAGLDAPSGTSIVLSADAAQRLAARKGQPLTIPLARERESRTERTTIAVQVAEVLPQAASDSTNALAPAALLAAIESWRDGYTVAGLGDEGSGAPAPREVYPRFRLHTGSIREVESVAARLQAEGVSTFVNAREIASTLGLQRNLRTVLALVGSITLSGAVVALTALQLATVRRKRREFALLKLTGHGRAWLVALPCLNALAVALFGGALAFGIYLAGAGAINTYFATHFAAGESAVRLGAADIATGLLAAVGISLLPALWGGWRASNVEAADELRDP
jgi:putative ABC transport system permease protein